MSTEQKTPKRIISQQPHIIVDESAIKKWLKKSKGLSLYQDQLHKITTPLSRLQALQVTLTELFNNWDQWSQYYKAKNLWAFVLQAIDLTAKNLETLQISESSTEKLSDAITTIVFYAVSLLRESKAWKQESTGRKNCAIDDLLKHSLRLLQQAKSNSEECWVFNLSSLFNSLYLLHDDGSLPPVTLANTIAQMGLLAQTSLLAKEAINIHWLENYLQSKARDLTALEAGQYFIGLTALAAGHHLKQRIHINTINSLLRALVKGKDTNVILVGLRSFKIWLDQPDFLGALNMEYLAGVYLAGIGSLSEPDREIKASAGPTVVTRLSELADVIEATCQAINNKSTTPQSVPVTVLEGLLQAALKSKNQREIIHVLLSVGRILQIGGSSDSDKKQLRLWIDKLVLPLNEQAGSLPLSDISHILYALALLEYTDNRTLAHHLVSTFKDRLKKTASPHLKAHQVLAHQGAHYLAHSGQIGLVAPPYLKRYLGPMSPRMQAGTRQASLIDYLQKQKWFNDEYECKPSKVGESEEILGIHPIDVCITHKITGEKLIVELDDPADHRVGADQRLRWQDVLRDRYSLHLPGVIGRMRFLLGSAREKNVVWIEGKIRLKLPELRTQGVEAALTKTEDQKQTPLHMVQITVDATDDIDSDNEELTTPIKAKADRETATLSDATRELEPPPEETLPIEEVKNLSNLARKKYKKNSLANVLRAIEEGELAPVTQLLNQGALNNADEAQKADLLIQALEQAHHKQTVARKEIIYLLCERLSGIVFGSVSAKKKMSPAVYAAQLGDIEVLENFIIKAKLKEQAAEWQKALRILTKKAETQDSARFATIIGILQKSCSLPSSAPLVGATTTTTQHPTVAIQTDEKDTQHEQQIVSSELLSKHMPFRCACYQCSFPKDNKEYLRQLRKSARRGVATAQYNLAMQYLDPITDLPTDAINYLYWLEAAAKQDYVEAYARLGEIYLHNGIVEKNEEKALAWFELGAENSERHAQYCLGNCYLRGLGIEENFHLAVILYLTAASQNHKQALQQIIILYDKIKSAGLSASIRPVYKQYQLAAIQGDEIARRFLDQYEADLLKQDDEAELEWPLVPEEDYLDPNFAHYVKEILTSSQLVQEKSRFTINSLLKTTFNILGHQIGSTEDVVENAERSIKKLQKLAREGNLKSRIILNKLYQTTSAFFPEIERKETKTPTLFRIEAIEPINPTGIPELDNILILDAGARMGVDSVIAELERSTLQIWPILLDSKSIIPAKIKIQLFKIVGLYTKDAELQFELGVLYANASNDKEAVRLYQLAAKQGHSGAQNNLGLHYEYGRGVGTDLAEAARLYQSAAEKGEPNAQNNLGNCYQHGKGIKKDVKEAVKLYRQAADQGNPDAQYNLGVCLYVGITGEKKPLEGIRWLHKAVKQNLPVAIARFQKLIPAILQMISHPDPSITAQDKAELWEIIEKYTIDSSDSSAQFTLGVCYERGYAVKKDMKKSAHYYRLAADQGDLGAQNDFGVCCEHGRGVDTDLAEAVKWYQSAAEKGEPNAQNNLGNCYQHGKGIKKDAKEAMRLYRLAATQGHSGAQNNLGLHYEYGRGVDTDLAEAVKCYKSAAEKGEPNAQNNLGTCYQHGKGIEKDAKEATRLYRLAATQGNPNAQYNLGICLYDGTAGEKNQLEALRLLYSAAQQNFHLAISALKTRARDVIGMWKEYDAKGDSSIAKELSIIIEKYSGLTFTTEQQTTCVTPVEPNENKKISSDILLAAARDSPIHTAPNSPTPAPGMDNQILNTGEPLKETHQR